MSRISVQSDQQRRRFAHGSMRLPSAAETGANFLLSLTRQQGRPEFTTMARNLLNVLHSDSIDPVTAQAFFILSRQEIKGAIRRMVDFDLELEDLPSYLEFYLGKGATDRRVLSVDRRPLNRPQIDPRAFGQFGWIFDGDASFIERSERGINFGGFAALARIRDEHDDPLVIKLAQTILILDFTEQLAYAVREQVFGYDYDRALGFLEELSAHPLSEQDLLSVLEFQSCA